MAASDTQQIYKDLAALLHAIRLAQYHMTKADRIIYGNDLIKETKRCIAEFVRSFDIRNKRTEYIESLVGEWAVLVVDLRDVFNAGVIKEVKRHPFKDDPDRPHRDPEKIENEIFDLVARIDKGIGKGQSAGY